MIIEVRFATAEDADFQAVTRRLDVFLEERYGAQIAASLGETAQAALERTVVAYADGIPIGCGGWGWREEGVAALRRLFVLPAYRRQGAATALLSALQKDAQRAGAHTCALITGVDLTESIQFYRECGYEPCPSFSDVDAAAPSVCMSRTLQPAEDGF